MLSGHIHPIWNPSIEISDGDGVESAAQIKHKYNINEALIGLFRSSLTPLIIQSLPLVIGLQVDHIPVDEEEEEEVPCSLSLSVDDVDAVAIGANIKRDNFCIFVGF